jgi:phosphatidylethanolamine-binding protein
VAFLLQNGLTLSSDALLTNATPAIQEYYPPSPPLGSGAHRYVVLALAQPANFTPPANLSVPGVSVNYWE